MNSSVDAFFNETDQWREELFELREIVLGCGLTEELKWGHPCYTFDGSNIVLLGGFKEYCALTFCKGVLLSDPGSHLIQPGEHTQSARMIRFGSVAEIAEMKPPLISYIYEAVEVEKAGLKVVYKDNAELVFTEELQNKLADDAAFTASFEALTSGRQRAYNMVFATPKQEKTRESRIEKFTPRILDGKGLNDCACGLSKKMPACDGSHKILR